MCVWRSSTAYAATTLQICLHDVQTLHITLPNPSQKAHKLTRKYSEYVRSASVYAVMPYAYSVCTWTFSFLIFHFCHSNGFRTSQQLICAQSHAHVQVDARTLYKCRFYPPQSLMWILPLLVLVLRGSERRCDVHISNTPQRTVSEVRIGTEKTAEEVGLMKSDEETITCAMAMAARNHFTVS